MSVQMFISDPVDDAEKMAVFPVLTEDIFSRIVLPVAEKIGAEMVCRLGGGVDVTSADFPHLEQELRSLLEHLPPTPVRDEYIEPRILGLIDGLRKVFVRRADAVVYIG